MLTRLVAGLETMHDDACRRDFLLEIGRSLDAVSRWLRGAGLDAQVNASYTPTFLHGGSSSTKWIVMGINPGADDQQEEHNFKRQSPENYLAFHEQFFLHFPQLRRNGKQPWWSKLYRVTRVLHGVIATAGQAPWRELHRSSSFVVQDLLPFHGPRSEMLKSLETGCSARSQTRPSKACLARALVVCSCSAGTGILFSIDILASRSRVASY